MIKESVSLSIAGVAMQVSLPRGQWVKPLVDRYGPFVRDATPEWQLVVHEDSAQGNAEPGWVRHQGTSTSFHVQWYRGAVHLRTRRAWVTAPSAERLPSAVDRTIAYILMLVLPRERDALLLHACGVEIEGKGYAFFGPSGAGKTTVARLAEGHAAVMADENVVLQLTSAGVALRSTPFWGASTPPELVHRTDRSAPLAGLFHLAHSPDFHLAQLPPARGVAALLDTEKVATERVESAEAWLDVAGKIVERVPVNTLSFAPTEELWSFLARHEGDTIE